MSNLHTHMTNDLPPQEPLPWSFSVLDAFETCPRKYYLVRVARAVKEPLSEHITWGNEVHKALELRVKNGTELPNTMKHYEPMAAKIAAMSGEVFTERKFAITRNFQPAGWFDKNVWCRAVIDVGTTKESSGVALDYKTGKRKPGSDQLRLAAAIMFHHFEWLTKVTTGYVWLADKKIDKETYARDQVGEIWNNLLPRVGRFEEAFRSGNFPPKPSGLCRKHCVCTSCEFCGTR